MSKKKDHDPVGQSRRWWRRGKPYSKKTVEKVQKLLEQFVDDDVGAVMHKSNAVACKSVHQSEPGGAVSVSLFSGKLVLFEPTSAARIDGVGFGNRYTTNVWAAVDALRAHQLISREEQMEFRDWLHDANDEQAEKTRLESARAMADALGYDLVKRDTGKAGKVKP